MSAPVLDDMGHIAAVNATELWYDVLDGGGGGGGPPIVVMHGGLGIDHAYFRPWLDRLADNRTVVYYDHRGNGRSARGNLDGVDHATWAADCDALRAMLGFERIVLVGHSYGGYIAQEYALRYPQHLAGLVLSNTAPAFDYTPVVMQNAQARATPAQLQALTDGLSRPATDDADFRATWNAIFPLYFHRPDPAIMADIDSRTSYSAAAYNRAFGACLPTFNTVARLPEIEVPTLVVGCDDDWITPVAQGAQRLAAGIPGARVEVIADSGHFGMIEQTDRYLDVVRAFVKRLP